MFDATSVMENSCAVLSYTHNTNAADAVSDCITCALCAFSIQVSHNSTPLLLCTYIIVVVNVVSNVMAQFQLIC